MDTRGIQMNLQAPSGARGNLNEPIGSSRSREESAGSRKNLVGAENTFREFVDIGRNLKGTAFRRILNNPRKT